MLTCSRVWRGLIVLALGILSFGLAPAYACGCGIYIPRDGDAKVAQERSLLRWDGQHEDIVMSLGVLGGSSQAAIILPVPSQADVKLADAKVLDELDEMTKPLEQQERKLVFNIALGAAGAPPQAAGGAPPVSVLSRQNLGPFDVANLAATDAGALKAWLDDNGFKLDPRITDLLRPYIEKQWTFVAVRVQPDKATQQLEGSLAPLWIAFDSPELVYPMRPSALADNQQTVNLYVFADHRVDKTNNFGASRVSYANWVEPAALAADSQLAPFVSRKYFLTKFIDTVNPNQVNDDFQFTFAAQDIPYREVKIIQVKQDASSYVFFGMLGFVVFGILALITAGVLAVWRRTAKAA